MNFETTNLFIGAASFEERSLAAPRKFIENQGRLGAVSLVLFADESPQLASNLEALAELGLENIPKHDRFSSRSLWNWVWGVVKSASGEIVIDVTCLPREALAMLLFSLSVRRKYIDQIKIVYTSVPEGYATQDKSLEPEDRWLSKGVATVRSILGFPGNFGSEKLRHIIAFAGHESDRLLEAIVSYEPNKLSISNEMASTSTVEGAAQYSENVADQLRQEIALPKLESILFSANSIMDTYDSLCGLEIDSENENVAIVAMNTKLSFIGAALFCLHERNVRMIYAVPEEYNPLYSKGFGECVEYDITDLIKTADTLPVD